MLVLFNASGAKSSHKKKDSKTCTKKYSKKSIQKKVARNTPCMYMYNLLLTLICHTWFTTSYTGGQHK